MYLTDLLRPRAGALDDFRDWSFSFDGITEYLGELALHHIQEHGFQGLFIVVVVVLIALVMYPPTRYIGSQLTTNLISAVFSVIQLATLGLGMLAASFATKFGLAGLRNAARSVVEWSKKK